MKNHFDKGLGVKALIESYQPTLGVELGVFKGANTQQLLSVLPRLIAISDGPCPFLVVPSTCVFKYIQGVSYQLLKDFNQWIDFCSLDTDHNGWTVQEELSQLEKWTKKGSLLVAHDTTSFGQVDGFMRSYGENSPYPLAQMRSFPVPYGKVLRERKGWKVIKEVTASSGAIALERV